ncbi:right-handed parallel beta-helix repeat-containing protein [Cellulomonas sp. Y8]|uniref:right-handed parallel beta-helix repeat-containing protein n=1 Tax=Cellulomonas sp. Y8 TaxID=2591145 RepID=UPI00143D38F1|nr:right-handed parallel beta-helix repeat-containing protein [Cellulomonas sp. Y8]
MRARPRPAPLVLGAAVLASALACGPAASATPAPETPPLVPAPGPAPAPASAADADLPPDPPAERTWRSAFVGNVSGSGANAGSVEVLDDGSVRLTSVDGKIAESEDGFVYHYTEIDPATENFTLTATFHVDDASAVDNQSGYGVIALDTFVPGSKGARYFNSAAAAFARQTDPETGQFRYGTAGGRFVSGYTEAPDVASTARSVRDSAAFDWGFRSDLVTEQNANPPKILTGDTFTLTLRRSNTGFHAWLGDEDDRQVIAYDPAMLLQQTDDAMTVGVFAGRKIQVTVTDLDLTTVHPDDDDPAVPRPVALLDPALALDSATTTPSRDYAPGFTANVRGAVHVRDASGDVLGGPVPVVPGVPARVPLHLPEGRSHLTAVLEPAPEAEQELDEGVRLASTEPVPLSVDLEVRRYGVAGDALHVAPTAEADVAAGGPPGSPDGAGTRAAPLDLATALAFAQPGQQVVLRGGTYRPEGAVVIPRGRDGTPDARILLTSAPGEHVLVDLSGSPDGGFVLRGDFWHVHDIEVTAARGRQKAFSVMGNDNVVERLHTHHNGNTGLQISGDDTEPRSMWPARNLVLSSVSHHNVDPERNDADGFAAKLTVGDGNVFRYCIAHHNVDDGFDLYAKSTLGPHGSVAIEHSVAYRNGYLTDDPAEVSPQSGKGFKLGGESIPLGNVLTSSVAYGNVTQGVSSNSSPDGTVQGVTAYANGQNNLTLSTTTHPVTDYRVTGFLSVGPRGVDHISLREQADSIRTDPSNYLDGVNALGVEVRDDWFVHLDTSVAPTIAADGSIDMHGLLELTAAAPAGTGARLLPNPDPTEIVLGPEPGAGEPGVPGAPEGETPAPGAPGLGDPGDAAAGDTPGALATTGTDAGAAAVLAALLLALGAGLVGRRPAAP